MQRVIVGTSGWNYDHWEGVFYPEGLARSRRLEHYCLAFNSVEVNSTFYRTMSSSTFDGWRRRTPEGFVWAVKANRFMTHIRRLRGVRDPLDRFMQSLAPLGGKLGPVLFQLPPTLSFDRALALEFLSLRAEGSLWAVEARHPSWATDEALACLEEKGAAWCISDTAGKYPFRVALTAPFSYIRLHGSIRLYASSYGREELEQWAERIRALAVDTYVYFDNDAMGYAPANALSLKTMLGSQRGGFAP